MKRILFSLGMIVLAGGAVATGTGAFFSDTETSSGNTFTAGSIDLKIDHSLSTYNGSVLGGSLTLVSDTETTFAGDDGAGNSLALSFIHPAWTASIPGATWIWATQGPTNPGITQTNTFTRTFNWSGPVTDATLDIASDNSYTATVNGNVLPVVFDNNNFQAGTQDSYNVSSFIVTGANTIEITVTNLGVPGSDGQGNPAGLLYKLTVSGEALTWSDPVDLTDEKFYNFDDVKPGDSGRDDISLHVSTNDAWACMAIDNVQNNENTLIEPETTAGDVPPPGAGNGELGQFLNLFLWTDTNADGNFNPPLETPISSGLIGSGLTLAIHDSTTANGVLPASVIEYIGAAWCAGTQTVNNLTGAITCDGSGMGNIAQTDSLIADISFYAEQVRNNPNFTCVND